MATPQQKDNQDLPTVDIAGIELFETGEWNGDRYEEKDLQAMVDAFPQVGFEPPVKAGHAEGQEDAKKARLVFGEPALGYVSRIYLVGKKLLGDLKQVPKRFADLIKAGSYKRISSEIYWQYKSEDTGKIWPRVLKAIAFLGADIPALTNLKAIESLFDKNDAGGLFAYDEQRREFRAYERDYHMECGPSMPGMSIADYLLTHPRKAKDTADFEPMGGEDSDERCGNCKYWLGGYSACVLVEGRIESQDYCELFEPNSYMVAQMAAEYADMTIEKVGDEHCVMKGGKKTKCYPTREEAQEHMASMMARKKKRPRAYTVEKRGDEWCLIAKGSGKTLGCHPSREKAQAQEATIKANMERGDISVTREQMAEVCPSCAESMAAKNFAAIKIGHYDGEGTFVFKVDLPEGTIDSLCEKFGESEGFRTRCMDSSVAGKMDDAGAFCNALKAECGKMASKQQPKTNRKQGGKEMEQKDVEAMLEKQKAEMQKDYDDKINKAVAKAKEEGKAEADKENEKLRADVRKLESQKRSEGIDHWIATQKKDGKLVPAQEGKVKALLEWAPDEGTKIKYFAAKDGTTEEVEASPAEIIKSFILQNSSLFKVHSKDDGQPDEGRDQELEDAGAELDRRAKAYQTDKKVSYLDAFRAVSAEDPDLARRYAEQEKGATRH